MVLNMWEEDSRLPTDVIPEHYDLLLNPDLKNGTFSGRVEITINVTSAKNFIILHAVDLKIERPYLKNSSSSEEYKIIDEILYSKNEFYVIVLEKSIPPGTYNLELWFYGSLLNKIIGFYRSSYKDVVNGEIRLIATSKFEPTYARQAFPCFDEPCFKAEFTIQLVKPSGNNYIALSNMNQVGEVVDQPQPGLTIVQFAKSVPMSTYLACFIVCDFDKLEPVKSKQGFPVTVYARSGQANNMQYTLDLGVKTIDYYIDYFAIDYPLPKLDLIAIPDFVSGAMEHWGLVTFRETSVLVNEAVTSSVNKKYVSYTVAHELAHMWFGNLVTMKWWNDLWLNEGFATFIEYKGVENYQPEWDVNVQQLTDDIHDVLNLDAAVGSHPIVQTVSHPDHITEIFDAISYSKGATVIRMLENMIGPEAFRHGVSSYLKQFAYKNAETEDLWKQLEVEANGINISQVMGTWTRQMGYPLVNVVRSGDNLTFTQQRFLSDSSVTFKEDESIFGYKWDIHLTYVTSTSESKVNDCWLYHDQPSVSVNLAPGTTWFKVNHHQFGYFRVRYAPDDWQKIVNMLLTNHESVSAADRANLLDDVFNLASSGYISYKLALDVIQYLPKEHHFVPWIVASVKLKTLKRFLISTPVYMKFRKFVHKILEPIMSDSLWDISASDSYIERRRKIVVLELGCAMHLPSCVARAKHMFNDWLLNNSVKRDPEIRNMIYTTGLADSDESKWERVWQLYLSEEEPQEKAKLRNALTKIKEPWLLKRLIELAKDENNVRSQDFIQLLATISENPVGNPIVWDFYRDQWSYLVKRFTLNSRLLGRLLPCITADFGSQIKLTELKSFVAANPEAGAGAAGRCIALELIENNIRWLASHLLELETAFNEYEMNL